MANATSLNAKFSHGTGSTVRHGPAMYVIDDKQGDGAQKKAPGTMQYPGLTCSVCATLPSRNPAQWNCSSSVEPVRAFTEEEPPWMTVVTSSK